MKLDLSTQPPLVLIALGGVVVIQLTLQVISLVLLARTSRDGVVFGRKWPWVVIIVGLNLIGAIAFLTVGRRAAPLADVQSPNSHGGRTVGTVPD